MAQVRWPISGMIVISVLLNCWLQIEAGSGDKSAHSADEAIKDDITQKEAISRLTKVMTQVKSMYVEKVSYKTLLSKALGGMLKLDPHSRYINQQDLETISSDIKGRFSGIGVEVTWRHNALYVISAIHGGPAYKNKIKPGDYIVKINNTPTHKLDFAKAVEELKGPQKTIVNIDVYRENQGTMNKNIKRDNIKVHSIKHKIIEDGTIGYIEISSFLSANTHVLLQKAVEAVLKSGKIRGLILDLRNNYGGQLNEVVKASSLFIKSGSIVSIQGRTSQSQTFPTIDSTDITKGLPIVVLINERTISAGEIFAAAMQDNKRALLVGTKSYGKASVQVVKALKDHEGAMQLTIARYYTPKGYLIQDKGIIPDVQVKPIQHLVNIKEDELKASQISTKAIQKAQDSVNDQQKYNKIHNIKQIKDFQLERAIDILRAMSVMKNHHHKCMGMKSILVDINAK